MTERVSLGTVDGTWNDTVESVNAMIDDLVRPTTEISRVIQSVARGDLTPEDGADDRGPAGQGRVLGDRHDRQRDGRPARLVRRRGHARRARGRHGRKARRPGAGQGRQRHVARPDRERQLDGVEPDRPGAPDRGRHDGGRQRRPVAEDHRRRARRDPRAQGHDQHDGRPAVVVRRRGHARRARGRHGGPARRPGGGQGRQRHVARPDRERELHGVEPDRPGAPDRRRHDRRRAGRPDPEGHRRGQGRGRDARRDDQLDDRHAARLRRAGDRRRARGRHRRRARRPGRGAGRRRHVEGPDGLRQHDGLQPHRPGAPDRASSRPPSPTATCRRRSPSRPRARSRRSPRRSTR